MRSEFYTDGKELIGPAEWEKKILSIKSAIEEDLHEKKTAKKALAKELVEAVIGRVPPEKFGVLFSGGVDSSVIALILKNAGKEFVCYTLGFKAQDTKEPEDVGSAIAAAKNLGLKIRARIIDVKEAEGLIKMTVKILGLSLSNVVNVGVGAVVLGCAEMAKEDGVKFLFSGLGSEEIFAGYHRHKLASDRQEECWNGLLNMYERDLLRDSTISATAGFSILTPFLDERLMATAMRIPAKYKIDAEHSKLILREVAEELGLPSAIAWRQKRAAQYGSRLDKAIAKLAHQKKFKYKKDYLRSIE